MTGSAASGKIGLSRAEWQVLLLLVLSVLINLHRAFRLACLLHRARPWFDIWLIPWAMWMPRDRAAQVQQAKDAPYHRRRAAATRLGHFLRAVLRELLRVLPAHMAPFLTGARV